MARDLSRRVSLLAVDSEHATASRVDTNQDQVNEQLKIGTVLEHPCLECGASMMLRESKFGLFYGCSTFPVCRATHGAHKDGRPLGITVRKATGPILVFSMNSGARISFGLPGQGIT